mmetsp:Transcript_43104/g.84511  ORF Transcript_43104/g.84511 Transcript_43104/m.84511 type:complete len:86 (+) Transcript_43104:1686-1943(+)
MAGSLLCSVHYCGFTSARGPGAAGMSVASSLLTVTKTITLIAMTSNFSFALTASPVFFPIPKAFASTFNLVLVRRRIDFLWIPVS